MIEDQISPEELKEIKEDCIHWSNNCGGCETCAQVFAGEEPVYGIQQTFYLICMIEDRDKKIKELEDLLQKAKNEQQK